MSDFSNPFGNKNAFNYFAGDFDNRQEIEFLNNEMFEYIKEVGVPIFYYTINVDDYKNNMDVVYGENSKPKWDRKYKILALLEDFTQENRTFGGIGLENIDETSFYIHRSMFDEIIGIRSQKAPTTNKNRRGAWGPIAGDQLMTIHNGLIYEVVEGGLHFLSSQAQHFGHKFWYKVSCKSRQVSDATMGAGEQYGATPDPILDPKYVGNPQYLLDSPTKEELYASNGTVATETPITPAPTACAPVEYTTVGLPVVTNGVPSDLIDSNSGGTNDKYVVPGLKDNSLFRDNEDVVVEQNAIVNPDTDNIVDPNSQDGKEFGPTGRVIPHKRKELFKDWDS